MVRRTSKTTHSTNSTLDGTTSDHPVDRPGISLWAAFVIDGEPPNVQLYSTCWTPDPSSFKSDIAKSLAMSANPQLPLLSCEILSETAETAEEFSWWLADHGFTAVESMAEWKRLISEIRDIMYAKNQEILGKLRPCPVCSGTTLVMKSCMTEPGGFQCCPWVICDNCGYTGANGRTYDVAGAVARWESGDIDLISYLSRKLGIDAINTSMTLANMLSGGEDNIKKFDDHEVLTVIATELEKRAKRCREIAGIK